MSALRRTEAAAVAWTEEETTLVNQAQMTIEQMDKFINEAVCAIIRHPAFGVRFPSLKPLLERAIHLFQPVNARAEEPASPSAEPTPPSPEETLTLLKRSVTILEDHKSFTSRIPDALRVCANVILNPKADAEREARNLEDQRFIRIATNDITKELQARALFANREISYEQSVKIVNDHPFGVDHISYIPVLIYFKALKTLSSDPTFGPHFKNETIKLSIETSQFTTKYFQASIQRAMHATIHNECRTQ